MSRGNTRAGISTRCRPSPSHDSRLTTHDPSELHLRRLRLLPTSHTCRGDTTGESSHPRYTDPKHTALKLLWWEATSEDIVAERPNDQIENPPAASHAVSRRAVLRTGLAVVPVLMTLPAVPAWAQGNNTTCSRGNSQNQNQNNPDANCGQGGGGGGPRNRTQRIGTFSNDGGTGTNAFSENPLADPTWNNTGL